MEGSYGGRAEARLLRGPCLSQPGPWPTRQLPQLPLARRGPGLLLNHTHLTGTFHWLVPLTCGSLLDPDYFRRAQSRSAHNSQPLCRTALTEETHFRPPHSAPWKPRSAAALTACAVLCEIHVCTQKPPAPGHIPRQFRPASARSLNKSSHASLGTWGCGGCMTGIGRAAGSLWRE